MLELAEARRVYERVVLCCGSSEQTGAPQAVYDDEHLARCLARAYAQRDGIPLYPALFAKAGITLCAVGADGPFGPLNTAIALALVAVGLAKGGYELRVDADEAVRFLKAVQLGFTSWHRASVWLKGHTVRASHPYEERFS